MLKRFKTADYDVQTVWDHPVEMNVQQRCLQSALATHLGEDVAQDSRPLMLRWSGWLKWLEFNQLRLGAVVLPLGLRRQAAEEALQPVFPLRRLFLQVLCRLFPLVLHCHLRNQPAEHWSALLALGQMTQYPESVVKHRQLAHCQVIKGTCSQLYKQNEETPANRGRVLFAGVHKRGSQYMSSQAAQSEKICFFFLDPRHGQNPLFVVYVSNKCAKRDHTLDALW